MSKMFKSAGDAFDAASQAFHSSRFSEAEALCRQILSRYPRHPQALHLLGVLVGRVGDLEGAVKWVDRAVKARPELIGAHLTLGQLHVSRGDLPRAIDCYQRVAALRPGEAVNWFSLGIVERMDNRTDAAIVSFRRTLAIDPLHAEAHMELGVLLRGKHQFSEAAASFVQAVKSRPDSAAYQNNLGAALVDIGQMHDAEEAYLRAIRLSPSTAIFRANLGDLFISCDKHAEAIEAYDIGLRLDPSMGRAHVGRGMALAGLQRFEEAIVEHEKALEHLPEDPSAHAAMADTLARSGNSAAAGHHCKRALDLNPQSVKILQNVAWVLSAIGSFDEAERCFQRTLNIGPSPYVQMPLPPVAQGDTQTKIQQLAELANRPDVAVPDRVSAGFALGKILDDANRCDDAFFAYANANTLFKAFSARSGHCFDRDRLHRGVDTAIAEFTPEFFHCRHDWGDRSETPVFVVGMPRSGTTLVEQIVATHSQAFGAGELTAVSAIRSRLGMVEHNYSALKWDRTEASYWAMSLLDKLTQLGGGAKRVIDKMPGNILNLGVVATLFPDARVIFCQRDPRDTCLSCYFQKFDKQNLMFSYGLADCAQQFNEQERLTSHWRKVLPLRMLFMQYEKLVADLEGQSRRLIDFLGLDWEPTCLDFYKNDRPILTASAWQVRQPIYGRSVGRWKQYEKHLKPLIATLGGSCE